eukprot:66985-Rhodomonas_salina.1
MDAAVHVVPLWDWGGSTIGSLGARHPSQAHSQLWAGGAGLHLAVRVGCWPRYEVVRYCCWPQCEVVRVCCWRRSEGGRASGERLACPCLRKGRQVLESREAAVRIPVHGF